MKLSQGDTRRLTKMTQNFNVITSVARMGVGDYEAADFPIGVEQRFVGALLNSHNNNLEEQFLLGLDCITTEWISQHGVIKKCNKYYDGKNEDAPKGYYILYSRDFSNATNSNTSNFPNVENEELVISSQDFNIGLSRFPNISDESILFSSQNMSSSTKDTSIPVDNTDTESLDDSKVDIAIFEGIPQDYTYPLEYKPGVVFLDGYGVSWAQEQAIDPNTGDPMVDEETGEPVMEELPILLLDSTDGNLADNDAGYSWDEQGKININPGFVVLSKIELWFRYDTSIDSDIPDPEHDTLIAEKMIKVNYVNNRKKFSEIITNKL